MNKHKYRVAFSVLVAASLAACTGNGSSSQSNLPGFEVKLLVGSALGDFCNQAAEKFNQQQPKVNNEAFHRANAHVS